MSEQTFSLLLPTRGRTDDLGRLMDSILVTARHPEGLEVILYVDEDDAESIDFVFPSLPMIKHVGPRTTAAEMTRTCYRLSDGANVFLLNDDVVFRTDAWDELLAEALAEFPDGVGLVYGNDLHQGPRLPTFPILPRAACELMGGPCPADYLRTHVDSHLLDVFEHLRRLGHDRIRYLPEVVFEHLHPEAGKAPPPPAGPTPHAGDDETTWFAWTEQRQYDAWLMARHIESAR